MFNVFCDTNVIPTKVQEPQVNNIKIRLCVNTSALSSLNNNIERIETTADVTVGKSKKQIFKRHHNFIVFRNSYVFIIFFKKGAVNITGIKRFDDLSNAVENFCATFGINLQNISNYM